MSEEEQKIYNIYLLAKKDGYTGTYEQWLASIKGADGVDGKTPFIGDNGNWWIGTTDTGVKANGKDGTNGADGTNGKDGSSILSGSGVPNATLGNDGDTYIDVSTGDTYKKTTGSWTKIGNINGECEHEYIPSINLEYKVYGSSVYITHTYTCANCSKEIHLPEDTPVVSFKEGKGQKPVRS